MRNQRLLFTSLVALCLSLASAADASTAEVDYVEAGKAKIGVVKVPHGSFMMGTDLVIKADDHWEPCETCPARNDVERPVHEVTITKDFWMGEFDVTQEQWQAVMGSNPSFFKDPEKPVEQVDFNDVQAFLAKLNAMQHKWTVRLPTEAEWEYAARAGTTGETYGLIDEIAWYDGKTRENTTHAVGKKRPNAFGLYDMLGNVWQWCSDWFEPYSNKPAADPQGAATGDLRITRGGCYYCGAVHIRAARRNRDLVDHKSRTIGFRVVATLR